jgi:hypothetical protein
MELLERLVGFAFAYPVRRESFQGPGAYKYEGKVYCVGTLN